MSRQSKKRRQRATGSGQTTPRHGKRFAWWSKDGGRVRRIPLVTTDRVRMHFGYQTKDAFCWIEWDPKKAQKTAGAPVLAIAEFQ